MLKSIVIVTMLVLNADQSAQIYQENLDYLRVEQGAVSETLSVLWEAPEAQGQPYVILRPDSDSEVYLRFVETQSRGNYQPMKTLGWNAVEIQAMDPDSLVKELEGEHFELIGEPAFLTGKNNVRAAQMLGPDRELLYFTHVIDPERTTFRIGTAQSRVDRVFIMVLGTRDLQATSAFYNNWLGQSVSGPWPYRVRVLSRAWGKPDDTVYDLSVAQLEEDFLIEIDEYPQEAQPRTSTSVGLPFGPAVVSFLVEDLTELEERTGRSAQTLSQAPYGERRVLYIKGPSGEGIELVEQRRGGN